MTPDRVTISDLIMEYFRMHQKQDVPHGPVVDYVEERYLKIHGRKPRDTWRQIRRLHQMGILIKVRKGVYRYDPDAVTKRELHEFPPDVKDLMFTTSMTSTATSGARTLTTRTVTADSALWYALAERPQ